MNMLQSSPSAGRGEQCVCAGAARMVLCFVMQLVFAFRSVELALVCAQLRTSADVPYLSLQSMVVKIASALWFTVLHTAGSVGIHSSLRRREDVTTFHHVGVKSCGADA